MLMGVKHFSQNVLYFNARENAVAQLKFPTNILQVSVYRIGDRGSLALYVEALEGKVDFLRDDPQQVLGMLDSGEYFEMALTKRRSGNFRVIMNIPYGHTSYLKEPASSEFLPQ